MRRISLLGVNVALWVVIGFLIVLFHSELRWAARALPRSMRYQVTESRETDLRLDALKLVRSGADPDRAIELLEQSIAIDPNSQAVYLLGEVRRARGELDAALVHYNDYLRIDPSFYQAYLRIAGILGQQGRYEEQRQTLERGVTYFERNTERYRPRIDDSVRGLYNDKALGVHGYYREGLAELRRALAMGRVQQG